MPRCCRTRFRSQGCQKRRSPRSRWHPSRRRFPSSLPSPKPQRCPNLRRRPRPQECPSPPIRCWAPRRSGRIRSFPRRHPKTRLWRRRSRPRSQAIHRPCRRKPQGTSYPEGHNTQPRRARLEPCPRQSTVHTASESAHSRESSRLRLCHSEPRTTATPEAPPSPAGELGHPRGVGTCTPAGCATGCSGQSLKRTPKSCGFMSTGGPRGT